MAIKISFIFIFSICISLISSKPSGLEVMYMQHLSHNNNYICSTPQPRAISINEIFTEGLPAHEKVTPLMTVLHRCDKYSGYCRSGCECGPNTMEEVTIMFAVENKLEKKFSFRPVKQLNHTSCACSRK